MSLANRDAAIIRLNPSVVTVIDGVPYDADNNVVSYDADAVDTELNIQEVRMIRNAKLAQTDWMSLPDAPTMSDAWKTYRQALRDITKDYKSLDDVVWPTEPSL